jgi:DNA replication protein DnaC
VQENPNLTNSLFDKDSKYYNCEHCGVLIEPEELTFPFPVGEKRYIKGSCDNPECITKNEKIERQRQEEEERQRLAEMKAGKIRRLFDNSRLSNRFIESTFENWVDRPELRVALNCLKDYANTFADSWKTGAGLFVFGPPGVGKTHAVAAIVNSCIKQEYSAIFQSVPELLSRLRATYRSRSEVTEENLLDELNECDLLVLDDIGAEKWSEWVEEKLYSIIDMRYRQKKPLIITSNYSLDDFNKAIGFRAMDRLIEVSTLIELEAESYRKIKARERCERLKLVKA